MLQTLWPQIYHFTPRNKGTKEGEIKYVNYRKYKKEKKKIIHVYDAYNQEIRLQYLDHLNMSNQWHEACKIKYCNKILGGRVHTWVTWRHTLSMVAADDAFSQYLPNTHIPMASAHPWHVTRRNTYKITSQVTWLGMCVTCGGRLSRGRR